MPAPSPSVAVGVSTEPETGHSLWSDAWHRLRQNRLAVFGASALAILAVISIVGPPIVYLLGGETYNYDYTNLSNAFAPPALHHPFGTDQLGHDLLVRVMIGARISLGVGLCATVVALTIGVVYGAVAGYAGGKTDATLMRLVDILYALPFTIFVLLLMVFFGRNIVLMFVAIGAVEWLTMARIVRGQVQSLRKMEFIEAARALGFSNTRIIFRHLLPNLLGPIIVYATLTIPSVMLLEAFLSFLGLGVQPPMSSWGTLIKDGANNLEGYWWLLVFPGSLFSLTLFSLNFLGDGLRDALDVRSAKD
jgi:oligopeptide transport system permease protein